MCACEQFTLLLLAYIIWGAYYLHNGDMLNALLNGRMPYCHAILTLSLYNVFDTADSQYYTQDNQ